MLKKMVMVLAIILILTGCARESFPEPQETLLEFVHLWQEAEYEKMYSLLAEEARLRHEEETFVTRHTNISSGISLREVSLTHYEEKDLEDGTVEADYTLTFLTGTVQQFDKKYTALLRKGEERWLLEWDHNLIFPELAENLVVRVKRTFPERGSILDRSGAPLASPGQAREVGVVPGRIADEEMLLESLARLLQISEEAIYRMYTQSWVKDDMYVPVKKITELFWQEQRDNLLAIQGVMVKTAAARTYDVPPSLAQTVGYIREINAEELELWRSDGYRAGDMTGSVGLEAAFEKDLAGQIGIAINVTDQKGDIVATVGEKKTLDGSDIKTAIDLQLQKIVDTALGDYTGSVVVINHKTGELPALASKPGFDPNIFALGITSQQYAMLQELESPFLNRTISGLYPPGSAFKPFTALIALHEDVFEPEHSWDTPLQWQKEPGWGNYRVTRVNRPSGPVNLTKAMKWSDNVYFADLALKIGWNIFLAHGETLGFARKIPFELNISSSRLTEKGSGDVLLADTGYGQGEMLVSPLHLALMYSAIARGDGFIPQPTVLSPGASFPWLQTPYNREDLQMLDDILRTAVRDEDAFGHAAHIPGKDIRGKTGTAQISSEKQLGWFACYFDDYTLVVLLEGDSTMTSSKAMEVARTIIEEGF